MKRYSESFKLVTKLQGKGKTVRYWETALHESLTFLLILQTEALTTFILAIFLKMSYSREPWKVEVESPMGQYKYKGQCFPPLGSDCARLFACSPY